MRRITSAGVSLSALDLSASAFRAAGRSRQRVSQALRFGVAERSMSTARLMTAATLRSATVKSLPSRYFCLATAASRTLNGAAKTFKASLRLMASRSAGGRRTACSDQMLTPRSTSVTAHRLHCHAVAAWAQQGGAIRHIGILMPYPPTDTVNQSRVGALRQELQRLGWTRGANIEFD